MALLKDQEPPHNSGNDSGKPPESSKKPSNGNEPQKKQPKEKIGKRPSFEGDYIERNDEEEDPLKELQGAIIAEGLLGKLKEFTSVSLGNALDILRSWHVLEDELNAALNDIEVAGHPAGNPIIAMPIDDPNNKGQQITVKVGSYSEYLANLQKVDLNTYISVRVNPQVFQGSEKRIGITYDQAEVFEYLFSVVIKNQNNRNKFLARVRFTDVNGDLVEEDFIPISVDNLSFVNHSQVAITPAVAELLINRNYIPDGVTTDRADNAGEKLKASRSRKPKSDELIPVDPNLYQYLTMEISDIISDPQTDLNSPKAAK